MGPNMYVVLAFIGGVIVGGLFCFFGFPKLMPNHRMQDELTRSKRELATAQRALEEYMLKSTSLFAELDKQYQQYAQFMQEASSRINAQEGVFLLRAAQRAEDQGRQQELSAAPQPLNEETAATELGETQPEDSYDQQQEEALEPQQEAGDAVSSAEELDSPPVIAEDLSANSEEIKLPELKETDTFALADQEVHDKVRLESAVEDVNETSAQQEKI